MNRKMILGGFVAAAMVGAPAYAQSAGQILKGTAIGAGVGAIGGAVLPGISTGTGALVGAAGGAAITALDHRHHHHWHHDRRGSYWIDYHGRRHYRR